MEFFCLLGTTVDILEFTSFSSIFIDIRKKKKPRIRKDRKEKKERTLKFKGIKVVHC